MPLSPPPPGTAIVIVIVVDPARVGEERTACLSAAEREQAARFRFEKDANHWCACRSALRHALGEALGIDPAAVAFEFGEFGKPSLARPHDGLHFNLSHCRDLALIALCGDGPVGVDVEPRDRAECLLGCEDAFCHPEEMEALANEKEARASTLLEIWTAKEALLKALGTGMSVPPQSVSVDGYPSDPRFRDIRLHRPDEPALEKHFARVATPTSVGRIDFRRWPA
jgi:4'-phosphopantetheinyl transferase